jgi:hypothetical protein
MLVEVLALSFRGMVLNIEDSEPVLTETEMAASTEDSRKTDATAMTAKDMGEEEVFYISDQGRTTDWWRHRWLRVRRSGAKTPFWDTSST